MAQGDWDFQNAGWTIDNTTYVSSPSSYKEAAGYTTLSRRTNCQVLPQGRIITNFRASNTARYLHLSCRNQAALGTADMLNTYAVIRALAGSNAQARRFVDGSYAWTADIGAVDALSINTWYKFRITWWNDWGSLRFRLERWVTDAWVQEGIDVSDPANTWATSGVNRVGFASGGSASVWQDDTEIWGPS
jgi:hypothetical protein